MYIQCITSQIFKEVRDNTDSEALQRDLDSVVLWALKWQMEFNVKKCKVMAMGIKRICGPAYLQIEQRVKCDLNAHENPHIMHWRA